MKILTILLYAHSGIRWLILLTALLALVIFGYGWLGKKSFPKLARIFPLAYSSLLDAQVFLGFVFMVWTGLKGSGFPLFRFEHMTIMIFAEILAHLPVHWQKTKKENLYRNVFFTILGSLVLIYVGVAMLPGGWNR